MQENTVYAKKFRLYKRTLCRIHTGCTLVLREGFYLQQNTLCGKVFYTKLLFDTKFKRMKVDIKYIFSNYEKCARIKTEKMVYNKIFVINKIRSVKA